MILQRKEIVDRMEKLGKGQALTFSLPATFGGGVAIIELNPHSGKKYILKVAKDVETAQTSSPYWEQDKVKHVAKWVADRLGDLME
jgi:hypothetical protein